MIELITFRITIDQNKAPKKVKTKCWFERPIPNIFEIWLSLHMGSQKRKNAKAYKHSLPFTQPGEYWLIARGIEILRSPKELVV